ncbi:hypothetical protein Amsp01_018110 [Amycolatopsis sp. NBRC 101858]|uniref:hypothetical protein n=1 Tax=Amycolatopsis sp. NBRC 101858 TaxID=3032200 RepID=UPI0024A50C24|nr:hypothetical protein [Amycolatopsis sp. NBRC 101858]GLY35787.1 hypothetical protein Amsp01_018110 [Amycolatopsis sp. NBRC 101858]
MREQVSPEEPARLGLTVRAAILAAAELISDVPIPRSPVRAELPAGEAVQGHA